MTVADDTLTLEGVVTESHRGDRYIVSVKLGTQEHTVSAKRSGRMVLRKVLVVAGDSVTVEVSAYDLSKGRIVYRK